MFRAISAGVRALREKAGLSQTELAKRSRVDRAVICNVESAKRYLSAVGARLSVVLGEEVLRLMLREDDLREGLVNFGAAVELVVGRMIEKACPKIVVVWTAQPGALTRDQAIERLAATPERIDWADLLRPERVAEEMGRHDLEPAEEVMLGRVCARWINLMTPDKASKSL